MSATTIGTSYIWGVPAEIKPIHGLPRGKARLRLRPGAFARVFVRNEGTFVGYHLIDKGPHWQVGTKIGENHRFRV